MADDKQVLVKESTVAVVSSADPTHPVVQLAHFLLPCADGAHLPALPSPPRNVGPILYGELQVEFKGWEESPSIWRRWVDKLRPRYEYLWRKLGILDSVLATMCRVRRDEGALLQLAAIWSGETNTFLFPWGEATVALEDVAVLGGLPLFGEPVRASPPAGALRGDVEALETARRAFYRSKNSKANHRAWAKRFLERPPEKEAAVGGGEAAGMLEHGAFLAMWLSLFVLPAPPFDVVRAQVLPIAARLARGRRVALAPAALASMYSDLSALNRYINLGKRYQPFVAWAPLHILQLWVWERFPELRPALKTAATTHGHGDCGEPRAARWHDVHKVLDPRYVHAVFMSPNEFHWRPYGSSSFAPPPENGGSWVDGRDIARSNKLLSFARCLRPCELVGMSCIEQYHPHRVARQLGFDQDVPGIVPRVNSNWEAAWATYELNPGNFAFIVPQCKLTVTVEYAKWWEPYSLGCDDAVVNAAKLKELRVLVSARKRKIEVLHDANSGNKQDLQVEMLNGMISNQDTTEHLAGGAESSLLAEIANPLIPRRVRTSARRAILHKNGEQSLSDEQNSSSEHGEVVLHHLAEGVVSASSNGANGTANVDHVQSTLEEIVVISDDESYELVGKKDEVSAMHLKPPFETTASSRGSNAEMQLVSTRNNQEDSPMLKEVMVQSNCDCELATVPNDITLRQEPAKVTNGTTVQPGVNLLEGQTEETQAHIVTEEIGKRDKMDKENLVAVEVNAKSNGDISSSNQELDSLKCSGNNKVSCTSPVDANTGLVKRAICTKTLYYLRPSFMRKKDVQDIDASGANTDPGTYQPKREVGTREMIKEAFAAREVENIELQKKFDRLKEELVALHMRLRNESS